MHGLDRFKPSRVSWIWPANSSIPIPILRGMGVVGTIAISLALVGIPWRATAPSDLPTGGGPSLPAACAAGPTPIIHQQAPAQGQHLPTLVRTLNLTEGTHCPLAFSPDGRTLATGGDIGRVRLWDLASGEESMRLKSPQKPNPGIKLLIFSPDRKTLAVAYGTSSDGVSLRLWDLTTAQIRREFRLPQHGVAGLAFSPDGGILAAGEPWGKVYLWAAATGREMMSLKIPNTYNWCDLAFSPDGKTLAGAVSSVLIWDVGTGEQRKTLGTSVGGVRFSPDGKTLFGAGKFFPYDPLSRRPAEWFPVLYYWNLAAGKEHRLLPLQRTVGSFSKLLLSPDGKTLVTGCNNYRVDFWEVASGNNRLCLEAHRPQDFDFALSSDGHTLATSWGDGVVRIWDTLSLRPNDGTRTPATLPPQDWERQWTDLASRDAAQAYRAICTLVRWPKEAVSFLEGHLQRLPQADARRAARLVLDLDSNRFADRQKATDELEKLGGQARGALKKFLAGQPSLEARRRAEDLLEKINFPITSPDQLRVIRSVEVLEKIGNAEAKRLLGTLAEGTPGAELTEEATAALTRLSRPPSTRP